MKSATSGPPTICFEFRHWLAAVLLLLAVAVAPLRTAGDQLHYPTDIYAGRVLAQAIVHELKANSDFQRDFTEAKAEIAAAQTAKNSN